MTFTNASDSITVPSTATTADPRVVISTDDPLLQALANAGISYYYDAGSGFVTAVQKDGTSTGIFRILAGPANANFADRDEFLHAEYDFGTPLLDSLTLGAGNRVAAPTRPEMRIWFDNPSGTPISILDLTADKVHANGAPIGNKFVVESLRNTGIGAFTADTTLDSVTFQAEPGIRYRAVWEGSLQSSVAGDDMGLRMKLNGTAFYSKRAVCAFAGHGAPYSMERSFVPIAAGGIAANVTLSVSALRIAGTGGITAYGAADQDNTLQVFYA